MFKLSIIDKISFLLVIIGAINWGVIGLFNLNFISLLVAGSIILQKIIYIMVFVASLNLIYLVFKCKTFK
ncbi:DUF378 domain-containing protein [Clostridium gasigenes]|uniref:DUF378 domain-containing protein n=1 Tax=Clostridium gasigenes TaxID=94869 RepID=A0A1H0R5P9_9CLOT|nr:DUF378 domain-containing protein [Clostridium gasigenes]MBB6622941.1 DUF378 domain-containing protein [Clostridium gasigenes]MBB6715069.1 DUF378 domain-containing protein [Clostridium gasigenes]MBU3087711.1 DUF378 domain-containing protein [Clostridium gasigenes]MBU3132414.1 DUF378 domain-containing protein [Clostridium gasigenes]MBU3135708.1 DUF378 domain-containing protein [Clostridium gasigenes]